MNNLQPTLLTSERIRKWENALAAVKDCKARLNSAECDLLNATNELGKWIVPSDAKIGETFNIWHGDGLISASYDGSRYEINWRMRRTSSV